MSDTAQRLHTLNNGVQMPMLGLGVFQTLADQTAEVVHTAIESGYRLIDTASAYQNERQVGEGVRRSGVARRELFVTTKLWMTDYGYEAGLRAFDISLKKLGFDYVDLYLLHWPIPSEFDATLESYRALERLLSEGRTRAIGVSNFTAEHMRLLGERTSVRPAVNQVEAHPFYNQRALVDMNSRLGVVTQAWSPIGGAYNRNPAAAPQGAQSPMSHPLIRNLAEKRGKTPAQIILRWHIDRGTSAIPKSSNPKRIAENFDIFDFSLSPEEMAAVDGLDCGARGGHDPDAVDLRTFSYRIPDE